MGSGTSTHKNYRTMTVIDYAGGFTGNGKCPLSPVKGGTSSTGTTTSDTSTSGSGSTDNQSTTDNSSTDN